VIDVQRLWSKAAEAAVLGSMMLDPGVIPDVVAQIDGDDFYEPNHKTIFDAIMERHVGRAGIDGLLVRQHLADAGMLEKVGGLVYLQRILESVPSAGAAAYYARIVKDKARLRAAIAEIEGLSRAAADGADVDELVEGVQAAGVKLAGRRTGHTTAMTGRALAEIITSIRDGRTLLRTGFRDIDGAVGGFAHGEMIVVAGRPAMGKTALVLSMLRRMERRTLLASLEMPADEIGRRLLAMDSGVNLAMLTTAHIESESETEAARKRRVDEQERAYSALWRTANGPAFPWLTVTDETRTLPKLSAMIARIKPEIVAVDHVGLMQGPGKSGYERLTELSHGLKALAMQYEVPVIVVSQLNRGVEAREDRRPRMSDLRETGALEEDADLVMMLYRESYYRGLDDGRADVIVSKNRRGDVESLPMTFLREFTRFEDMTKGSGHYE